MASNSPVASFAEGGRTSVLSSLHVLDITIKENVHLFSDLEAFE
jgi:hypothetical protein